MMKKLLLLTLTLWVTTVVAQRVIDNPKYEFRNTGISRISRVECTDSTTKVHLRSEFIPNWWVAFNKEELLLIDTESGDTLSPLSIEGAKWGEKKPTPASGIDNFVFTFPALQKKVEKIDWVDGKSKIFGIQLKEQKKNKTTLPKGIEGNWLKTDGSNEWTYGLYNHFAILNNKLWKYTSVKQKSKSVQLQLESGNEVVQLYAQILPDGNCLIGKDKKNTALFSKTTTKKQNDNAPQIPNKPFFQPGGMARFQGYINGYDPRAGFTTGLIYLSNEVAGKSIPTVVEIHPDGHFNVELAIDYPMMQYIVLGDMIIKFYVAPGETLTMSMDWEDLLQADRYRDRRYVDFKETRFMGPTGNISQAIQDAEAISSPNYRAVEKMIKNMTPAEFKQKQIEFHASQMKQLEEIALKKEWSPKTKQIIKYNLQLQHANFMFDFLMQRGFVPASQKKAGDVQLDYYNFLNNLPLDNEMLLSCREFSTFINRFEFAEPFSKAYETINSRPIKSFPTYILESNTPLSPKEKELMKFWVKVNETGVVITEENKKEVELQSKGMTDFVYEHLDLFNAYEAKYLKPQKKYSLTQQNLMFWNARDTILMRVFKLQPSLVYNVTKVRSLKSMFEGISRQQSDTLLQGLMANIPTNYLKTIGKQIQNEMIPVEGKKAYAVPEGKAGDIFRKLVDPHKGKVVLVDFWAVFCGPCIRGIKEMAPLRDKYKDKDVAFVFVTDESSSPLDGYEKCMAGVNGYKHRLTEDDYNYLRQLFKFNGIPHYVLLDKQGRVVNDNFNTFSTESEFERLLKM